MILQQEQNLPWPAAHWGSQQPVSRGSSKQVVSVNGRPISGQNSVREEVKAIGTQKVQVWVGSLKDMVWQQEAETGVWQAWDDWPEGSIQSQEQKKF